MRLALALGGVPFTDTRVPFAQWAEMKPTTPYGQLPLLKIDGKEPMAQSDAMVRYAGKLAEARGVPLYPPELFLEVEEALGLAGDLQRDWRAPVYIGMNPAASGYPDDFKGTDEHAAVVKRVRESWMATDFVKYMGILTKRLEKSKFLVGDTPTIADCMMVPLIARFASGGVDFIPTDCLEAYPVVVAYLDRFMAIPEVKAWYADKK